MKFFIVIFLLLVGSFSVQSEEMTSSDENEGSFDVIGLVMEHITDAHQWHVLDYTNRHGQRVHLTVPLPVILWHEGKFWFFSSDRFYHSSEPVALGNDFVVLHDERFYLTDFEGTIHTDKEGHIVNASVADFSITQNVASMFLSVALILWMFLSAARNYARYGMAPPKGFRAVLEPIILFVRDDIARAKIPGEKADKFVPFLITVFFFIWINNLIGIVPFFPGGSNLSGNISFTATLAVCAFLAINLFGSKSYWKHTFTAPGIPFPVKFILVPLEIIGMFTKPFALMIRLFANITAGHIIILSLISIIFILKSIYIAPMSVALSLIMYLLELLVAVLQAYIFSLLTALFIGMSTSKSEH